jgi:hypothetical protein
MSCSFRRRRGAAVSGDPGELRFVLVGRRRSWREDAGADPGGWKREQVLPGRAAGGRKREHVLPGRAAGGRKREHVLLE